MGLHINEQLMMVQLIKDRETRTDIAIFGKEPRMILASKFQLVYTQRCIHSKNNSGIFPEWPGYLVTRQFQGLSLIQSGQKMSLIES
jgi:hypothetical protein